MFPIRNGLKQGDALLPLLFNFALEYAIRLHQCKCREYGFEYKETVLNYSVYHKLQETFHNNCAQKGEICVLVQQSFFKTNKTVDKTER